MTYRTLLCTPLLFLQIQQPAISQTFADFLVRLRSPADSLSKARAITEYLDHRSIPVVEGSRVHFLYRGKGGRAAVPCELNRWNPADGMMTRIEGTDLFFRSETLQADGRMEYKIWVDSAWMLDSLNPRKARGGYGENSDVWMPAYQPAESSAPDAGIPHGRIDTLWIKSIYLERNHPVFVYVPPRTHREELLPVGIFTDGEDYLALGRMNIIIDELLSGKRIKPFAGVFVDPKTDLHNPSSNQRMNEYAANDRYLDFLESEVLPVIEKEYLLSPKPIDRVLFGASMGGLISTYAAITRPEFVANSAVQSPAYYQADSAVIKLLRHVDHVSANIYMQTGTIHDTEIEARLVRNLLEKKGANVRYEEFHEGHNWTNWRAHMGRVLEHFFGGK